LTERLDIERIQKSAAHRILGEDYISYSAALHELNLELLPSRRNKLCLKFSKTKAEKHEKHRNWFKHNTVKVNTRQEKKKYCDKAKHARFEKSPLCFLTKMLNQHYRKKPIS
jgi:hypothetical protein